MTRVCFTRLTLNVIRVFRALPIKSGHKQKLAAWLFRSSETSVQLLSGPLEGKRMALRLRNGEVAYWAGTFESHLVAAIESIVLPELKAGTVIFDIGAHIGYYTLLLAELFPRSKIYAFEPHPENFERLRANVSMNSMLGRVQLLRTAVSDREGKVRFHKGPTNWSGGLDPNHRGGTIGSVEVMSSRIDSLVFEELRVAPQLIKIDVEGYEEKVLYGGQQTLSMAKPVLVIECHSEKSYRRTLDFLREVRYSARLISQPSSSDYHLIAKAS